MAKSKTIWKWRNQTFESKKELLTYLRQRTRESVKDVLGPPADEVRGQDFKSHSVNIKIRVSLGVWPPRNKKAVAPAVVVPAGGKRKKPEQSSNAAVDKEHKKYFGS